MTRHEFRLPDVGEGVAEGEVVAWLVEPGDTVTEDQPVAEVETDKAVVDVPSPYDGRVVDLHWEVGDVVPVGEVLLTFETDEEAPADSETAEETAESASPDTTEASASDADTAPEETDERVFAPPHVRRRARELGVDITTVEGSGPSGRVTEADVEAAASGDAEPAEEDQVQSAVRRVEAEDEEVAADSGPTADGVEPAEREKTLAVPAARKVARKAGVDINDVPAVEQRDEGAFVTAEAVQEYAAAQEAAQATDATAVSAAAESAGAAEAVGAADERVPYRGIRRTIGEQMERSKFTAPHVTHHDDVVVERLAEWRNDLKTRAEDRDVKLTYMPFIMKAVVAGLRDFPYLNSQLDEEAEEIVLRGEYNLGVAVATEAGLMVPVVEHVDQKGILELAEETQSLAARARDRDLAREEMQGSTFTLTNFGAIGGEYATPIINYPEVGILGLGAIQKRPVVEEDEVVARRTLPLSLSIDHRVVDGAVAAEFVNTVKEYLADPRLLLLD